MILRDWRDLPASDVAPLQALERERWLMRLGWDLSAPLEIIEDARQSGYLPGFVACENDGTPLGWTYFILHDGMLQIGGLTASRPSVARALLDAILASPEAGLARRLSCFVFPDCDGVASALTRQRFFLNESLYLGRVLPAPGGAAAAPAIGGLRSWREDDLPALIRLLEGAYQDVPGAACFAPDGRRDQWLHYASQLVRTPACGAFDPSLSIVLPDARGVQHQIAGAVMCTRLGSSTMHVAQIAIAPSVRRQGVAAALLGEVMVRASAAGYTRVTLMVDARNQPARSLYARLGFDGNETFLFGQRAARNRIAA